METTISVIEIKAARLTPKSLALVSEFALILYRYNGTIIDVHSEDVVVQVFRNVRKDSLPRLQEICGEIKNELVEKYADQGSVTERRLSMKADKNEVRDYRKL